MLGIGDMQRMQLYVVTKASSDGTFMEGDLIWISENGDLNNNTEKGWVTQDELNNSELSDFQVDVCKTHYLYADKNTESVRAIAM